jgi:hypothetical protein
MLPPRLFRDAPDAIWVPHLHAIVHTRLHLGVDRDVVEEDLATPIQSGDINGDEPSIAAFCAEYFDLAASVFLVTLDGRGHWQRDEE